MHLYPHKTHFSYPILPLFLLLLLLLKFSLLVSSLSDADILLQFKSSVSDPSGVLSSWTPPSTMSNGSGSLNHCSWYGVGCDPDSRVVTLEIMGSNQNRMPFYGLGIRRWGLGGAKLVGELSPLIGELQKLRVLSLPFHELKGGIPGGIWGLEGLEVLDLEGNLVSGELPLSIKGLRKLKVLNLGLNRIGGRIPGSISGLEGLEVLNLAGNEFEGLIPSFVGDFRKLWGLYLSNNRLEGEIPDVWGTGCRNLRYLDLSVNALSGMIPRSLVNCRELRVVLLFSNTLRGFIPRELGGLRKLEVLDVSRNEVGGYVPGELGNCVELSVLVLSNLDESRGERNIFRGSIPMEVMVLPKLKVIWAPKAGLHGQLGRDLLSCGCLEIVNLSQNSFSFVPGGMFETCKNLVYVDFGINGLSSKFIKNTAGFNVCDSLHFVFLEAQQLNSASSAYRLYFLGRVCSGTPSSLSEAELSKNVETMAKARMLSEFNASSDQAVTSSSVRNSDDDLQTNAEPPSGGESGYGSNRFNSIEIASIVSASIIVLVLLALVVLFIYTRKCAPRVNSRVQVYERKEIKIFTDIGVPLSFQNVVKATDCFSAGKCIGCGGFGATYKAEITPGVIVAVKKLAVGRFHCIQQFHAEIKTLGRIRHPNLVTLIGYHASETEMFLIYNYLSGGNLEKFIQERTVKAIRWKVVHKILLDVAHAIAYLHYECNPRVIHRDVKPSNILLDNELNAYLSDFGLSRMLENSETHATTGVAGTFGYLAPEYAMTCRVSEKADVYSYGVVLLELISDKKALDPSFSSHGNGFNIVSWALMMLRQGRAKEVFAPAIWDSGPHDDLVAVLHLAVNCTVDSFSIRPTMKQVVELLKQLHPL